MEEVDLDVSIIGGGPRPGTLDLLDWGPGTVRVGNEGIGGGAGDGI